MTPRSLSILNPSPDSPRAIESKKINLHMVDLLRRFLKAFAKHLFSVDLLDRMFNYGIGIVDRAGHVIFIHRVDVRAL
jgi:hypothetical protein